MATVREALYAVALEALADCGQEDVVHIRHPLSSRFARTAAENVAANLPRIAAAALAARDVTAQARHHPSDPALHDLHFTRRRSPRVSIIIPTRNAAALVKTCVGSLRATAGYDNYDITVIDHDSDEPELRQFLEAEAAAGGLSVMPYTGPFNYAAMNNAAVRQTSGELILFLNNDVDAFSEGWLDQLVATMEIDDRCAAVGCLLFYPDGDIQHAGVIANARRLFFNAHCGLPHDAVGYQGRIRSLQEYAAVTAALMLVRRSAFAAVGGFDEVFPNDYNDVDLCLRLRQAGHRILYTPHVRATHWESRTRRSWGTGKDVFVRRWGGYFARDPFYTPKLVADGLSPDADESTWRQRKTIALDRLVLDLGMPAS
jgi:GT2 family glycosyltransferase